MSRQLFLSMLLLWSCYACNTANKPHIPFADKPQPAHFSVNTNRDTVLLTGRGARIHIPANAIKAEGNPIQLEVTEIYDVGEMLASGIQTVSDHQLLSSGGMICIRPAGNATALILQPIRVEVPTVFLQEGMMHYTGSADEEGSINWTSPQPLPRQQMQDRFDNAKAILEQSCYSCHGMDRKLTGPALLHVTARRDRKWLYAFIRNSQELIHSGDPEANCLYNEYNMAAMTAYPSLTDADLESICLYIDQISKQKDLAGYYHAQEEREACRQYIAVRGALLAKRMRLLFPPADTVVDDLRTKIDTVLVDPPVYYDMVISAFGWHNLDMLLKDVPGVKKTRLAVTVKGPHRKDVQLFMVILELRVSVEGMLQNGKADTYIFGDTDELFLPLNRQAWIVVMGEIAGKTLFAKTGFRIEGSQQLSITPEISKPDAFNKWLRTLRITPVKNADMKRQVFMIDAPDVKPSDALDEKQMDSLLRLLQVINESDMEPGVGPVKNTGKKRPGAPAYTRDIKQIDSLLQLLQTSKPAGLNCGCDLPASVGK